METKYYTPEIEEFCVGFEYQERGNIDTEWIDMKCYANDFDIEDIDTCLENGNIRVKLLDREDIESCLFKYTGHSIDEWFEMEGNFQIGSWTSYKIQLHYGLKDRRIYINAIDCGDEHPLFEGTIKNLTEFKKVLKQIGI